MSSHAEPISETNFTTTLKATNNVYHSNCVLNIHLPNEVQFSHRMVEIQSEVCRLKELDIDWIFLYTIKPTGLKIHVKIIDCPTNHKVSGTMKILDTNCSPLYIRLAKGCVTELLMNTLSLDRFNLFKNAAYVQNNVFKLTIKMVFTELHIEHLKTIQS